MMLRVFSSGLSHVLGFEVIYCYRYCLFLSFLMVLLLIFSNIFQRHSDSDITESLLEDEVPVPWLMILLIQFGTMIIDRALYLRKNMFGKCVFQMILVFGVHIWMCFILPQVTQRYGNTQEGTGSCFLKSSFGAQFKREIIYIQWVEWPLLCVFSMCFEVLLQVVKDNQVFSG